MTDETVRVAVLIDCDNISHQWTRQVLGETAKHGTLSIRRGYGDWASSHLKGWREKLPTYAIQPVHIIPMRLPTNRVLNIGAFSGSFSG